MPRPKSGHGPLSAITAPCSIQMQNTSATRPMRPGARPKGFSTRRRSRWDPPPTTRVIRATVEPEELFPTMDDLRRAKADRPEDDGDERPASIYGEALRHAQRRRLGEHQGVFQVMRTPSRR
jgi:hypothetical protein